MNIELSNGYRIKTIPLNFVLEVRQKAVKGKHKGQEYYALVGYYNSLDALCRGLIGNELLKSDAENFTQLQIQIDELCAYLKEAFKALESKHVEVETC